MRKYFIGLFFQFVNFRTQRQSVLQLWAHLVVSPSLCPSPRLASDCSPAENFSSTSFGYHTHRLQYKTVIIQLRIFSLHVKYVILYSKRFQRSYVYYEIWHTHYFTYIKNYEYNCLKMETNL